MPLLLEIIEWKIDKNGFIFSGCVGLYRKPDKILTLMLLLLPIIRLPFASKIYSRGIVIRDETCNNQSKTFQFSMRSQCDEYNICNICFQLSRQKFLVLCINYNTYVCVCISKIDLPRPFWCILSPRKVADTDENLLTCKTQTLQQFCVRPPRFNVHIL